MAIKFYAKKGGNETILVSAYLPNPDAQCPPEEVEKRVRHCRRRGAEMVLGCDSNAHHTNWVSTDTNKRGEDLLEFLFRYDLEIVNQGNTPTFVTRARQEVLDLTVTSRLINSKILKW